MKTHVKLFQFCIVLCLSMLFMTCSEDDSINEPDNQNQSDLVETPGQVTEDDFEQFPGELGVILDARPLARKGYRPAQVTINIDATNGDFTQTVPIDQNTFFGQLKIQVEGLSDEAKAELEGGVPITPEYKDTDGNIIFTEATSTVSFQSNPSTRIANTAGLAETAENQILALGENTTYYIQRVNPNGSLHDFAWRYLNDTDFPHLSNVITANTSLFDGNEPDRGFNFIPISGETNTFAIRHVESSRFLQTSVIQMQHGGNISNHAVNLSDMTSFASIQGSASFNDFKFKFIKVDNGVYTIATHNGTPIKQIPSYGLSLESSINGNMAEERFWRVISVAVNWNIINIGTSYDEPVLPHVETGFSFNSTLTNCGTGELSQTVGVNSTESNTNTIGWEEKLTLSTSNTIGVSLTVGMEASVNYFGSGGSVSASVTGNYSHEWGSTEESTNFANESSTVTTELSSERTITVLPGSASLVYDVYQFYPNTLVNFAQRMRIEGHDETTGSPLSGSEIKTLLQMTKFDGIINVIEPNSLVITLKGSIVLDKIIKTESSVEDVPANCN